MRVGGRGIARMVPSFYQTAKELHTLYRYIHNTARFIESDFQRGFYNYNPSPPTTHTLKETNQAYNSKGSFTRVL